MKANMQRCKRAMFMVWMAAIILSVALSACGPNNRHEPCDCVLPLVLTRGQVIQTSLMIRGTARPVFLYLPHGYAESKQRYPTVILLDGETMFTGPNSWELHRTLDWLIWKERIPRIVAVAVSSSGADRPFEYTPWPGTLQDDPPGGGGEQFVQTLRDTLLPQLRQQYNLTEARDSTFIAGASLGGLLAAYALFAHDEMFAGAVALSPTYGWADGKLAETIRSQGYGNHKRFYHDMGTINDNRVSLLLFIQAVCEAAGLVEGADMKTVVAENHHHGSKCWRVRIGAALEFVVSPLLAAPQDSVNVGTAAPVGLLGGK